MIRGRPRKVIKNEYQANIREQWRRASNKYSSKHGSKQPDILVCFGSPKKKTNRKYHLRHPNQLYVSINGEHWLRVTDLRMTIKEAIEKGTHRKKRVSTIIPEGVVPEPLIKIDREEQE